MNEYLGPQREWDLGTYRLTRTLRETGAVVNYYFDTFDSLLAQMNYLGDHADYEIEVL